MKPYAQYFLQPVTMIQIYLLSMIIFILIPIDLWSHLTIFSFQTKIWSQLIQSFHKFHAQVFALLLNAPLTNFQLLIYVILLLSLVSFPEFYSTAFRVTTLLLNFALLAWEKCSQNAKFKHFITELSSFHSCTLSSDH